MSKILRCSELIPGCNFIARGESDEEVIEEASRHVRARHNLQKMSAGHVSPDSFTHGSSAQRMQWFQNGFRSGSIASCNTFDSSN